MSSSEQEKVQVVAPDLYKASKFNIEELQQRNDLSDAVNEALEEAVTNDPLLLPGYQIRVSNWGGAIHVEAAFYSHTSKHVTKRDEAQLRRWLSKHLDVDARLWKRRLDDSDQKFFWELWIDEHFQHSDGLKMALKMRVENAFNSCKLVPVERTYTAYEAVCDGSEPDEVVD